MPDHKTRQDAEPCADEEAPAAHPLIEISLGDAYALLKRQWREHPVAVVAAALGAGLVLGTLIGRGRR